MNIQRILNILFLIISALLLAACSNTSSGSPQPNERVDDPTSLESSEPSETKLIASDGTDGDKFGSSVGVSENTAIVGATGYLGSGSAYIFTRSGESWTEQTKLITSDGAKENWFGISVAISGDTAIVGAYKDNDNGEDSGSAYIFTRSGTGWTQQAKLIASDGEQSDYFGYSVAINGGTAIVGAYGDNDNGENSGSVYIFTRSGTSWTQQAKLIASDGEQSDSFGHSVAISGNNTIVGARLDDDNGKSTGAAYIFTRSGTNWTEQTKLIASDGEQYDYFGHSVAINGDTALVGASGHGFGAAYIFTYSGTSWTEQSKLIASNGQEYDNFGRSVAINGDTALVGGYENFDYTPNDGFAYIFTRTGTNWTEQTRLVASGVTNRFSTSIGISGSTAIVGAPGDNGLNSGAAYIYKLNSEEPKEISTVYVSSSSSGNAGGITFANEDILAFDTSTNTWSRYFDGSDVGLSGDDLNAFHLQPDGSILLSLKKDVFTIPSFATVRASDIIKFIPTSTGDNTQGSFEWYFDGSDVGLSSSEGIDAIGFTADGDLLVSIVKNFSASGVRATDKDLLAFNANSLGSSTSGTWSLYFDGSDVGLNDDLENIYGVWLDPSNDDLYLTTKGTFSAAGLNGDADDIFTFTPNTLGSSTSGGGSAFWNGDSNGFVNERVEWTVLAISSCMRCGFLDLLNLFYGETIKSKLSS